MICWGSWANTLKLAKPRRFELYYYDYLIGFALIVVAGGPRIGIAKSGREDLFVAHGHEAAPIRPMLRYPALANRTAFRALGRGAPR